MRKDATYREKLALLNPWMPSLISTVKKDLKNDHLKHDLQFCKKFLTGKNFKTVSEEELAEAYRAAMQESEKGESIAEFISNRWLLKHGEIYNFFEQRLSTISPNFTDLEELSPEDSEKLSAEAVQAFGATKSYLFPVLNSVLFTDTTSQRFAQNAHPEPKDSQEA